MSSWRKRKKKERKGGGGKGKPKKTSHNNPIAFPLLSFSEFA
jgi:hypothetical protein